MPSIPCLNSFNAALRKYNTSRVKSASKLVVARPEWYL
jgi:hypothetical protein